MCNGTVCLLTLIPLVNTSQSIEKNWRSEFRLPPYNDPLVNGNLKSSIKLLTFNFMGIDVINCLLYTNAFTIVKLLLQQLFSYHPIPLDITEMRGGVWSHPTYCLPCTAFYFRQTQSLIFISWRAFWLTNWIFLIVAELLD